MSNETSSATYNGFRFPNEINNYCVWFYSRFSVSFRDVELIVAERGITVRHETIRQSTGRLERNMLRNLPRKRAAWR